MLVQLTNAPSVQKSAAAGLPAVYNTTFSTPTHNSTSSRKPCMCLLIQFHFLQPHLQLLTVSIPLTKTFTQFLILHLHEKGPSHRHDQAAILLAPLLAWSTFISRSSSPAAGPMSRGDIARLGFLAGGAPPESEADLLVAMTTARGRLVREEC